MQCKAPYLKCTQRQVIGHGNEWVLKLARNFMEAKKTEDRKGIHETSKPKLVDERIVQKRKDKYDRQTEKGNNLGIHEGKC